MKTQPHKPLRVLILTYIYTDNDPRYGGEGRVVWETTQAMARTGARVFVVTSMKNVKGPVHPNISVFKIPFAKKDFLNFDAGELLKMFFFCIPLLFIKNIDVIHHLPTSGPDPFARFKFGRVFAESADPGWSYENPRFAEELMLDRAQKMQEAGYSGTKRSFDFWRRAALRFFTLIGVNESYPKGVDIFYYRQRSMDTMLKKLRPESKLVYVPNGVDTTEFAPSVSPLIERSQKGIRFIHVGKNSRRKGTMYLVKAFISILHTYPESELFLVGSGERDFVEELKKIAAPYPQIRFYEHISNEDLPGAYTSADVFCLVPLSGGSTPTVLAEAFGSGLPVIATKESGCGEVVEEYDAGFTVEPGNVESLAGAMTRAIEDRALLATKAKKALAASYYFSWDYLARTIIDGYHQCLKK